jgi:hypothetical protein
MGHSVELPTLSQKWAIHFKLCLETSVKYCGRAAVPLFSSIGSQPHVFLSHMQHTNPSPHLCFEGWCGATPRVLINRRAVLSHRRSMDHPTTVTLTPAVGILSVLVLFMSFYILVCGRPSGTYTSGTHGWCWTALCEVFT